MEGFGAPSEADDAFATSAPDAILSNFPPPWHSFITDGASAMPPQAVAAPGPPVWTNQAWEEPLWAQAPVLQMAARPVEPDGLPQQMGAEQYYPPEQMYPTDGVLKTMFDEPERDFQQQQNADGQPDLRRRPGSPRALRAESMVAGLLETPSSTGTIRTPGSHTATPHYMNPSMGAAEPGPSSFSAAATRTPERKPARYPYQENRPLATSTASNPSFSPTIHSSSNSAFAEVRRSYPSTPTGQQQWAHGYSSQQGSAPIPIGNLGQPAEHPGPANGGLQTSSYPGSLAGLATPPRPRPPGAEYAQHAHPGLAQPPAPTVAGQADMPWYLKPAAGAGGPALGTEPNPSYMPAAGNDFVAYGNPGQGQPMGLGASVTHPPGQHGLPQPGLPGTQNAGAAGPNPSVNAGNAANSNSAYLMRLVPVQLASGEQIFVPPNMLQNLDLGLVGLKGNATAPPKAAVAGHAPHAALNAKHKGAGSAQSTPSRSRTTRSHPSESDSERHTSPGQASRISGGADPLAQKRAELNESPYTKDQFKRVHLKLKQFGSLELARNFASACCAILPQKVHWRLVFELADLAKRENRIHLARRLFEQVCRMQPCSGQGWVEFAKLEEERGAFDRAAHVLRVGLECCGYNEHLLFRALRLEEKRGNLTGARELLAPLSNERIDQVWRTILEGAALEVRAGNFDIARKVYKYLMAHVGWYGPIYHEACRLEERAGRFSHAKAIVQRGLREVSRYGPLWFDAFRLSERLDIEDGTGLIAMGHRPQMKRTRETLAMALKVITKELVWKVHYERAQIEDRVAAALARGLQLIRQAGGTPLSANQLVQVRNELLVHSRWAYANAATACPPNLRWKVWLAAARTELGVGRADLARLLVKRSMREIPPKARYMAWLEMSRIEEFVGDLESARQILCAARQEAVTEWKIFLESVMLELRSGHIREATLQAETALEVHRGTGRLWAALITLRASDGVTAQAAVFRRALQEVPKSGEVWAEGARLHLNPLSQLFDPECAARFLEFAILFTPQYGDSFLELIRLRLVLRCLLPQALLLYRRGRHAREEHLEDAEADASTEVKQNEKDPDTTVRVNGIDLHPVPARTFEGVDVSDIDLRCGNAGPNYGSLWFHCRGGPSGGVNGLVPWCGVSSSGTVRKAREMMAKELAKTQGVYVAALLRWLQVRHDAMRYSRKATAGAKEAADAASDPEQEIASLEALLGKLDLDDRDKQGVALDKSAGTESSGGAAPANFGAGFGIGPGYGLAALIAVTCDPNLTHGWRGRALPPVSRSFSANLERAQQRRAAVSGEPFDLRLEDFSLGMVGLSRLMSRVSELPDEQRLRYLLGTDNINV